MSLFPSHSQLLKMNITAIAIAITSSALEAMDE
jgi:hypothetical protein